MKKQYESSKLKGKRWLKAERKRKKTFNSLVEDPLDLSYPRRRVSRVLNTGSP